MGRMRAIRVGALERLLHPTISVGTFSRGRVIAAELRANRSVVNPSFKGCGECTAGEQEPVSSADAVVSSNVDEPDSRVQHAQGPHRFQRSHMAARALFFCETFVLHLWRESNSVQHSQDCLCHKTPSKEPGGCSRNKDRQKRKAAPGGEGAAGVLRGELGIVSSAKCIPRSRWC
jgi:hypothetical protein